MSSKDQQQPGPEYHQIDLMQLNLHQLMQLKNQISQELLVFQDSLQTLKMAKGKYSGSKEALEQFKPTWTEHPVLVPLTGSMYVPGHFKAVDNVLIDIGTGYYVEMPIEKAKDYFKRKVDFVAEQMDKIERLGFEKNRIKDAISEVVQIKVQATMSAQHAGGASAVPVSAKA